MIRTVNFSDFVEAFRTMGRADQFSFEALRLIFDYLEDLEEDTGAQIELDPIAICCEWVEMNAYAIREAYDLNPGAFDDAESVEEWLHDNADIILKTPAGFVFTQF